MVAILTSSFLTGIGIILAPSGAQTALWAMFDWLLAVVGLFALSGLQAVVLARRFPGIWKAGYILAGVLPAAILMAASSVLLLNLGQNGSAPVDPGVEESARKYIDLLSQPMAFGVVSVFVALMVSLMTTVLALLQWLALRRVAESLSTWLGWNIAGAVVSSAVAMLSIWLYGVGHLAANGTNTTATWFATIANSVTYVIAVALTGIGAVRMRPKS